MQRYDFPVLGLIGATEAVRNMQITFGDDAFK